LHRSANLPSIVAAAAASPPKPSPMAPVPELDGFAAPSTSMPTRPKHCCRSPQNPDSNQIPPAAGGRVGRPLGFRRGAFGGEVTRRREWRRRRSGCARNKKPSPVAERARTSYIAGVLRGKTARLPSLRGGPAPRAGSLTTRGAAGSVRFGGRGVEMAGNLGGKAMKWGPG
jgi:hypothetical protein